MPAITPTPHNTCAVIVTYYPDDGFAGRLEQARAQFHSVIVVDNGSRPSLATASRTDSPHVHFVMNLSNLGIAAALNQGVNLALQEGFEWIVTLDQDTTPAPDMLATLLDVYRQSGGGNVMIGGNYQDERRGRDFIQCADATGFRERRTLITSGTLVSLSQFKVTGFFREDYFIDSVDHEFCLRARAHGFRLFISCRPVMSHSIGAHVENAGWLRKLLSFDHPPARKYFIARNTVATVKSYFFREPVWSMRQGARLLADIASILLYENEKPKKISAFLAGVAHGLRGNLGPIEKAWPNGLR